MKAGREDIEKFDAYLTDQLNDEERLLFESKLATDEAWAEEFELHQMIVGGIAAEKEARFRAVLSQQRQETFIGNNTWGKKFTMASAAVVLLGMVAVFYAMYRIDNPRKGIAKTDAIENTNASEDNSTNQVKAKNNNAISEENPELEIVAEVKDSQPKIVIMEDDNESQFYHDLNGISREDMDEQADMVAPLLSRAKGDADDDIITKDKYLRNETVEVRRYVELQKIPAKQESLANVTITSSDIKRSESFSKKSIEKESNEADKAPVDSATKEDRERVKVDFNAEDTTRHIKERILIEYFSSPLNYKGYTYEPRLKKVVVYGLLETKSTLSKYNEVLYLKNGTDFYIMTPTNSFIRLNKVTDKKLLLKLNQ